MTLVARSGRSSVTVELREHERIASRGRRTVTYRVRFRDGWIAAKDHPRARVEPLERGPGTVWERLIEIDLRVGAELVRTESEPAAEPRRDAIEHLLEGSGRARRRTRRVALRVGPRGELVPEPEKKDKSPPNRGGATGSPRGH